MAALSLRLVARAAKRSASVQLVPVARANHFSSEAERYPIWILPKDSAAYDFVYGIAESSSHVIQALHQFSGLPWWATIVGTGLLVRASLSPFAVLALRNSAKAAVAGERVRAVETAFKKAMLASKGNRSPLETLQLYLAFQRGVWAAQRRAGCHPWLSFTLPFAQIPVLLSAVLGARHSVLMGDESFEVEGALWFTDLTVHDPYYIVPATAMALGYLSLEVMLPRRDTAAVRKPVLNATAFGAPQVAQLIRNAGQMSLIALLPFVSDLPAGMFLLMSANSAWTIAYLSLVRNPSVMRHLLVGLPLPQRMDDGGAAVGGGGGGGGQEGGNTGGGSSSSPSGEPATGFPTASQPGAQSAVHRAGLTASMAGHGVAGTDKHAPARGTHTSSRAVKAEVDKPVMPRIQQPAVAAPVLTQPVTPTAPTPVVDAPTPRPVSPEWAAFAHHLQMHPRFLYHADGPIDLDKEKTYIGRIRTSFRQDMPWLGGSADPFSLAVSGGDRRMPWFTSPQLQSLAKQQAPMPQRVEQRSSETEGKVPSNAWFASVWTGGVSIPAVSQRPGERMRVNPRLFSCDRQGARQDGATVPVARVTATSTASSPRARGSRSSAAAPQRPVATAPIEVDNPLHILLPPPGPSGEGTQIAQERALGALPHAFVWPPPPGSAGAAACMPSVPAPSTQKARVQAKVRESRVVEEHSEAGGTGVKDSKSATQGATGSPQPATFGQLVTRARSNVSRSWLDLLLHLRRP